MEPWWYEVMLRASSGLEAEAIALTRKAAAQGSLAARVRLACFGAAAGIPDDEADRIVEQAHADVRADDATTHWVLSGAYDLLMGLCDYEERSRRTLFHLEAYARLTADPMAAIAVARNYARGHIGFAPDLAQAVAWYCCADALGQPQAAEELERLPAG